MRGILLDGATLPEDPQTADPVAEQRDVLTVARHLGIPAGVVLRELTSEEIRSVALMAKGLASRCLSPHVIAVVETFSAYQDGSGLIRSGTANDAWKREVLGTWEPPDRPTLADLAEVADLPDWLAEARRKGRVIR